MREKKLLLKQTALVSYKKHETTIRKCSSEGIQPMVNKRERTWCGYDWDNLSEALPNRHWGVQPF